MAVQLLYLTSTASTVVSANASVAQLSLTPGAAATTATGIANGTTLATWPYFPNTAASATTGTAGVNPRSVGWILDGTAPGSYATGVWSIDVATQNTSATGSVVDQFEIFLVTATTTAVTKILLVTGTRSSSTYTPSLAATVHTTSSVSVTTFNVAANQYLYVEVYFKTNTAGTSGTAVQTIVLDAPSGAVSHVTTPSFTGTGGTAYAQNLTAGLSFTGASTQTKIAAAPSDLTATTLALNPGAYYRMQDAGATTGAAYGTAVYGTSTYATSGATVLADSSTAALNGTYQTTGVTNNTTPPITINDTGSPLFDGSTGYATTGVPVASALLTGSAFSVSVWVLTGSNITNTPFIGNGFPPVDGVGFCLRTDGSSTVTAYMATAASNASINGVSPLVVNTEYFVVFTYDGSTMRLYRNGVQTSSSAVTGAIKASTHAMTIGFLPGYTDHYGGKISEFALFPTALTAANVSAMYAAGKPATVTTYSSALTAVLDFVATENDVTLHTETGALSFIGAQSKTILRTRVATLSFIGAQTRAIARAQTGALSFTGTFAAIKSPVYAFTATLSFIGASTKRSARGFSGAISFTGAQTKGFIRPFTAALTTSGAFVRSATRSFTAGVSFSAISAAAKTTTSSLTFTASQSKIVYRALTASLTPRGAIARAASRVLTASTSFAGSKSIAITRALTASVTPTGAQTSRVSLRYAHADAGALSFAATLTIQYVPVGSIVIIIGNGSYAGNNGNGASVTNQGNG